MSKERASEARSKVKNIEEEEEEMHKLTLEELEALNVLASESAVEQEMQEIRELKKELEELTEDIAVDAPKISEVEAPSSVKMSTSSSSSTAKSKTELEETKPEGWDSNMEKQIANHLKDLLQKLEEEAEKVNEDIGDELFVIDRDKDGVMTTEELRDAVQNVLNTHNTDAEVDAVMKLLDWDGDGEITRHELLYFAEKTREKRMAERGGDDDDEEAADMNRSIARVPSLQDRDIAPKSSAKKPNKNGQQLE